MLFFKLKKTNKINLLIQSIAMVVVSFTFFLWLIKNGFLAEQYNKTLFTKMSWLLYF